MTGPDLRRQRLEAWLALADPDAGFTQPVCLPMLTGSMAPSIPVGADLRIASARLTPFGVGHVVVFPRQDRFVAHRLILAFGFGPAAWYLEKGDQNPGCGLVRRRLVRGVVTAVGDAGADPAAWTDLPCDRRAALRSLRHCLISTLRRMLGR